MKNKIVNAAFLFSLLTVAANASTLTWTGSADTNWANGANWGGTAPTNDLVTDVANFNTGTYTNQPNAGTTSISGITVGSSSGVLTISGTQLSIGAGGITVASGAGSTTVSAPVTLGAAQSWTNNSAFNFTSSGAITNGGFTLTVAGTGNTSVSGTLSGTGGLTKSGTGTLLLSNANTYSGATTLSGGTLKVGNTTALGTSTIALNSGTLDLNGQAITRGFSAWSGDLTNSSASAASVGGFITLGATAGATVDGTGAITLSGQVTSGTLTKNGNNSLTLSGAGSDTSLNVVMNAGTLLLNKSVADGAIRGNLTINGGLVQYLASNQIHDTVGNVVVNGGSLDINSFSDTINSLQIGNTAGTTSGTVISTGGSGSLTISSATITVTNGSETVALGSATTLTLTKSTTSTFTLSGANTYAGTTAVSAGTLILGSTSALGTSTVTISGGATLDLNGQNYSTARTTTLTGDLRNGSTTAAAYAGNIAIINGTVDGVGDLNLSGALTSGVLTKNGTNTVTLSGSTNNTSLALVVNAGTVILNKSTTDGAIRGIDSSGHALTINGGTVQLGANEQIRSSTTDTATGIVAVTGGTFDINSKTETINGLQVGSTDGTVGGTVMSTGGAGLLTIAGSSSLPVGGNAINVTNGSASANLAGSVLLTKSTTSTFTLSGSNSYSGGTAVSAGTLFVNNTSGSATGSGGLTVSGGATIGGTGSSASSGFSVSGSGTSTGSRANVLVGLATAADTNTSQVLTLTASSASNIANANLTFNLNATQGGALGSDPSGSGTELSVGATAITFGSGTGSVVFTLNLQNEPAVVGAYTPYVLIAGTVASGGTGVGGSQYSGLTLGTILQSGGGITETIISGANTVLAFGTSQDQSWYGTNSELVLYQNTNTGVDDIDVVVVPEPGTWALMLSGLAVLFFWQGRKKNLI